MICKKTNIFGSIDKLMTHRLAYLFLSAFLFFTLFGFSQENRTYSIKWKSPVAEKLTDDNINENLAFEDVIYLEDGLPYYFIKKQLPSSVSGISCSLESIKLESVYDEKEKSVLKTRAFSNLSEEFTIKWKIAYDRGQPFALIYILPIRKTSAGYEKISSFSLSINETSAFKKTNFYKTYASNSVLANGMWYKIAVEKSGVFKLSYSFLKNIGVDLKNTNPKNIKIYGNGGGMLPMANSKFRFDDLTENAIYVQGETDKKFDSLDYILFYAKGPNEWKFDTNTQKFNHENNLYSDSAYYFITIDNSSLGKRILTQPSSTNTPTHYSTTFDDYAYHESELYNLVKSGREWYGEKLDATGSKDFSFTFPNLVTSELVYIKADIASRYDIPFSANAFSVITPSNSFNLSPGSCDFGCYFCDYATTAQNTTSFTSNANTITISVVKNLGRAVGWVNFIELNARRQLAMVGSQQLLFRDKTSIGTGNITQFTITNTTPTTLIWDVTDATNCKLQSSSYNSNTHTFSVATDTIKEFLAMDENGLFENPRFVETVVNQNLHALYQPDFIIVSHPLFLTEANRLADFHRTHDNLKTIVVTPQEIYNEFSSGAQDITAIRDFVKMFYDKANTIQDSMPKYLLLFGDGSYDPKKRFASNTNFIPVFESRNSVSYTNSYVSDDFFGLMDANEGDLDNGGLVDIGIGRFPVKSVAEAKSVVDKIFTYTKTGESIGAKNNSVVSNVNSNFGNWRSEICFIADDEDGNLHMDQANKYADSVAKRHPYINNEKIFLDAYAQQATPGGDRYPDAVDAINKRVNKGGLIINYTGHGGEVGLAHERIIEIPQINSWSNEKKMPLFFTATCEFSRFDDPARTSAGELVLLNPKGGGIGLMTTVRLVYSFGNDILSKFFYKYAFDTLSNGEMPRIGDVFRKTKVSEGGSLNGRNFTLLGDPALKLAYPIHSVKTTTVSTDTLKSLSTVTVTGYVSDKNGNKLTNYNGILFPTVYDKAITITNLANDGGTPMQFKQQKNIIYKGKASVTNGDFSFSFIVPKDVAGNTVGLGKISYYAENGYEDAAGYYHIEIGGVNPNAAIDNNGPGAELFMNDDKFVFGGTTNQNPNLFAKVTDDYGINTSGLSIGHDISAVLDNNSSNAIVLNDYYEGDLDNYKSGTIYYPFENLQEGKHTLKLKVWDVSNNSTDAYTEFVVAKSGNLALKHLLNYPNPFTTNTAFYFEHNQPNISMDVQIQVFTISGKLVKNINKRIRTEGFRSEPIYWDGKDDFGDKIARGVYVYSLKIKTPTQTSELFEKLVILN
ncbi:MAG: type IX secretion system sortase PorU [Bacteroidetes bacterium]|nr:type IX secretion system sortase PorU [Bacteroidota bacterium]